MRRTIPLLALLASTALLACAPAKSEIVQVNSPPSAQAKPPPKVAAEPELTSQDLVAMEVITSNDLVAADKTSDLFVRVHLTAKPQKTAKRPPINLALVVDTSGSMQGSAMDDARTASLALLDSLSDGDRLSVVVFHSSTEILVPSTLLSKDNRKDIHDKIAKMQASGTTDLQGGLWAGLREVQNHYAQNGINRLVLLGDGIPNDTAQIPNQIQQAASSRISITALGLGLDHDETLMSKLALETGGKYHYIDESSKVAKVFNDELLRLKVVAGRATQVAFKPGPGVVVKGVLGLPAQAIQGGIGVTLGDLSEGDERDVLVEVSVAGRRDGSIVELLDVSVSEQNPQKPGAWLTEKKFVSVKASADAAAIEKGRNKDVARTAVRHIVADAVVRAVALARKGELQPARALLDSAEKAGKASLKENKDDTELAEKLKTIPTLRQSLASLVPPPPPPPPPVLYPGGVGGHPDIAPAMAPAPAPPPRPAPAVMQAQAAAMETIQGD
ncbi:MAG: VWA domain-containing protein [Polyangiaceae bacterium]